MPRYKLARQQHVGEWLDKLQTRGYVQTWTLNTDERTAVWTVNGDGAPSGPIGTKVAEQYLQRVCDKHGIRWRPVSSPGGVRQYEQTQAWIADGAVPE